MTLMAQLDDTAADDFRPALKELVQRYQLLEAPTCVGRVDIEDLNTLRVLRHPDAASWITKRLRSEGFEPMVLVMSRRFSSNNRATLLPEPVGSLFIFHLGSQHPFKALEARLRAEANGHIQYSRDKKHFRAALSKLVHTWAIEKPWSLPNETRTRNVTAALKSVGDWGFRLSRNDVFHAYPSTFVHAVPANLLVSLGIRDDMVFDPFGGTAQTAIEAVKYGNSCVTADVNSVACLVAKARLTYLPGAARVQIRALDERTLLKAQCVEPPDFDLVDKWFHPRTLRELSGILGFIRHLQDPVLQTFFNACVSAIFPACTARRGEQHGYFADNCPLPRDMKKPPYQPAIHLFLEKVGQALSGADRLYGFIERQGRNPESELSRVFVRHVDVTNATPQSYGLQDGEVGAIITSPPYLCMADYALGQRLSYEWLSPTFLSVDFDREIGARRLRMRSKSRDVVFQYSQALNSFAKLAGQALRKGGFLAVVLGQPVARQYRDAKVLTSLDDVLKINGFEPVWQVERVIHWHRNHGYARLKKERISVHVRA
jgi:hypothetical protein